MFIPYADYLDLWFIEKVNFYFASQSGWVFPLVHFGFVNDML